jgi:sodium-dependent dicarboxylate transporter 2/3/5
LSPSALSSIDYNILALFGGGLALGEMLEETGLAAWMGSYLNVAGSVVPGGMPLTLVVATIFLSEIGSNTASVSIMVPIALGTSSELAIQPTVMGVALASGLGAMLPVSTPPNAIVYSTGRIKIGHMIRTGILVDLVGCFLVYLWLVGR